MTEVRRTAMDLLARREHSRAEIAEKLQRKYPELVQHFDEVLDQLEEDGLLSDERFAEAYVRYRRSRGFGPLLIRQELRGKGIDATLLEAVIDLRAEEWLDTLRDLIARKRRTLPSDIEADPCRSELAREELSTDPSRARPASTEAKQTAAKARQKLYRFCLSRGFTSDQIARTMR